MGNKIAATKTRSGVKEDNGQFTYGYDALNQLISVSKDGNVQREYTYDAFGNRVAKKEYADKIIETVYRYNRNHQLLSDVTEDESRRYQYDKRGNLLQVSGDEGIIKQFTFDARNVLSEALDIKDGAARKVSYQYNGLGNRTEQIWGDSIKPDRRIRYIIDLTRQYHNMLSETVETEERLETSRYYYDFNAVGMSRASGDSYFLHDDLGSAMSVINDHGDMEEVYAYDEFGNEFGNVIDARDRFQPLGYTGYQKEAVGDVYFAQARRYDAGVGRFVSEDIVRGATIMPISMNHYTYVMNQPEDYVDLDGKKANATPYAGITQTQYDYISSGQNLDNKQANSTPYAGITQTQYDYISAVQNVAGAGEKSNEDCCIENAQYNSINYKEKIIEKAFKINNFQDNVSNLFSLCRDILKFVPKNTKLANSIKRMENNSDLLKLYISTDYPKVYKNLEIANDFLPIISVAVSVTESIYYNNKKGASEEEVVMDALTSMTIGSTPPWVQVPLSLLDIFTGGKVSKRAIEDFIYYDCYPGMKKTILFNVEHGNQIVLPGSMH